MLDFAPNRLGLAGTSHSSPRTMVDSEGNSETRCNREIRRKKQLTNGFLSRLAGIRLGFTSGMVSLVADVPDTDTVILADELADFSLFRHFTYRRVAFWVVVYSPQIWECYVLQSGEGLSVMFLLIVRRRVDVVLVCRLKS